MQKKNFLMQFLIFFCYEVIVCPLIFKPDKVYFASSLIAKPSMHAIISRGLYIFYPISKNYFFVLKEVFQKVLSLCLAYIQERLLIKSTL